MTTPGTPGNPVKMKAIVLQGFGGPEVLRLMEVPAPAPGTGEVLVQVHAVSVNRTLDLKVRKGEYDAALTLPLVLGADPSGIVAALGPGVDGAKSGDRVAVLSSVRCGTCRYCRAGEEGDCQYTRHIGVHRWGGYAEYVAVPAVNTCPIPDGLSFPEATVVTRHFPAALNLLVDKAELRPGEWVLVMGAAGALGSCGVQVAKMVGARVIAGAGADARVDAARSFGADFGVNYRKADLATEVMRITEGHGVDVVFENIGDPTLWPGVQGSLAYRGRVVTAGAHGGGLVTLDVAMLYHRRQRIIGTAGGIRRDAERALQAAATGEIRAIISRVIPLEDAQAAHQMLEQRATIGKLILDPTLRGQD